MLLGSDQNTTALLSPISVTSLTSISKAKTLMQLKPLRSKCTSQSNQPKPSNTMKLEAISAQSVMHRHSFIKKVALLVPTAVIVTVASSTTTTTIKQGHKPM